MAGQDIFISRREQLAGKMGRGVGLFLGNVESPRDYAMNTYEFSQDSTFRYFFGMDRPGLVGVIDFEKNITYISGRDYEIKDFVLLGKQSTIGEEASKFGIENFIPAGEFQNWFNTLLGERELFFIKPHRSENLLTLGEITGKSLKEIKEYYSEEFLRAIIDLRNFKSREEIREMERATNVLRMMHLKAMEIVKPWMREYEVLAEVNALATKFNCTVAFQTICTKDPAQLYSHKYEGVLKEGDLLLLDCGVKTPSGYCGDITSTIPVSGKYTEKQKEIYDIVLEMFHGALSELLPGKKYSNAHNRACRILIRRFLDLGIFMGDEEEIFSSGAHSLFFPHGLGHMIGMDVYDMENYCKYLVGFENRESKEESFGFRSMRLGRKIQPGFTFTVEPGIYFIPTLIDEWKNNGINGEYLNYEKIQEYMDFGGIRFERDFVMEENGPRQLGKNIPATASEVEKSMWELRACRDYVR
ncbi:MAG: aminopeptidase P N-terminal domain-containing protein [Fusobacteriaceae bacterium]